MKKLILILVTFLSMMSFSDHETKPQKQLYTCEEVICDSIDMYEEMYGCMDTETYCYVYDRMMSNWC